MGVFLVFGTVDTRVVKGVDTDAAAGVDDPSRVTDDAHMDDAPCVVLEESEVAGAGFLHEIDGASANDLLRGVAGQVDADTIEDNLREP